MTHSRSLWERPDLVVTSRGARPTLGFEHACKLGCEGIVSKRFGSRYVSGRTDNWIKVKNPAAPAVKREAEEDWGKERRR